VAGVLHLAEPLCSIGPTGGVGGVK